MPTTEGDFAAVNVTSLVASDATGSGTGIVAQVRPLVLVIVCGACDGSAGVGDMALGFRLARVAEEALLGEGCEVDELVLGCSEVGPAAGQAIDVTADVLRRWALADGVLIVAAVRGGKPPKDLQPLLDHVNAARPRAHAVLLHGDGGGVEALRQALCARLETLGLVDAVLPRRLSRPGCVDAAGQARDPARHRPLDLEVAVRRAAHAMAQTLASLRGEPMQANVDSLAVSR